MLREVLDYIHNWFIKEPYIGHFVIENGALSPLDLLEGQRFRVVGSVLNDGLYTYHSAGIKDGDDKQAAGLKDEEFDGTVCALAVPVDVILLANEISAWMTKYGDTVNGPYVSESFGGYSYTKATNSKVLGGNPMIGWREVFDTRLNQWRKLC